jgi:hypothetical protein
MAKDILKEAIADAKAVREVALANAKAALEEAFTPKLQSMLSAKLEEDLDEDMYYDEDESMDEGMHDEDDMDEGMYDEDDMDEGMHDEDMDEDMYEGMHDEDDMDEGMHDEDDMDEGMHDEDDLDEEIDLEEILNELELEEDDDTVLDEEEDLEEAAYPNYKADQVRKNYYLASDVNRGLNESEEFDLDALLNEINNLEEGHCYDEDGKPMPEAHCYEEGKKEDLDEGLKDTFLKIFNNPIVKKLFPEEYYGEDGKFMLKKFMEDLGAAAGGATSTGTREEGIEEELEETKAALNTVQTELNEVNLLNSKLLYVNRIFKANNLDESQKLRVVETLDKAGTVKEAKLIYETIKDTFNVANAKKASFKSKTKSLKEGIGMASKAAGTSTAPKKEVISESNDMMTRFQKLANIKINE